MPIGAASPLARGWLAVTAASTVGAVALAALVAPTAGGRPGAVLVALVFLGPAMHVGATGYLVTLRDVRACARRHPVRLVALPALLLVASPLLVAHLAPGALGLALEAFFAWQFLHFAKQNVGIATLASTSHGAGALRRIERRSVVGAGGCGIVALVAHPSLLGLHHVPAPAVLFPVAAGGFALTVVIGLAGFAGRPREARPTGVVAAYAMALCFSAPLFLVATPYGAVGGMTIAHGLQYLVLLTLVAAGPAGTERRTARLVGLLATALVGGMVVQATAVTDFLAPSGRVLLGCYVGLVAAHFVVDASLWRLRDPSARAFVTSALPQLVSGPVPHAPPVPAAR